MKSSTRQYFQFAHHHILLLTLVYFSGRVLDAHAVPKQRPFNNTIPAILVFGDSTVDPGNNDYINTVFKGNFPPYGRDFANHAATGRFTNGRLPSDYIILYMGIKDYIPPYLNQSLSIEELITGVSFASAGTGYDPLTPTLSNVVSLQKQLEYFQEYRERLEGAIGKEETGFEVVSRACCGTGLVEASFMCNAKTPVCPDASKYIFWDAIHPTDRAYYLIFQAFRPLIDFIIKDSTS
ncbi:hypothetical protein CRG98_035232 [Punica granatum]|uniref:GDSL esterase/lipase At5g45960-like n=1 Tax=Punica granatum TaxID=22663 RepID=A0A2I0IKU9_PUNGR|nr:hypothetical protein CRG98_035232 [Punica granatum]